LREEAQNGERETAEGRRSMYQHAELRDARTAGNRDRMILLPVRSPMSSPISRLERAACSLKPSVQTAESDSRYAVSLSRLAEINLDTVSGGGEEDLFERESESVI